MGVIFFTPLSVREEEEENNDNKGNIIKSFEVLTEAVRGSGETTQFDSHLDNNFSVCPDPACSICVDYGNCVNCDSFSCLSCC